MNRYIKIVLLLVVACALMACVCVPNVCIAQEPVYKIPKARNFNPASAANDIEYIVNQKSVITTPVANNAVSIDGTLVAAEHSQAVEEMTGYVNKLNSKGMYLNRELSNTVFVKLTDVNLSEFVEVTIDPYNLSLITGVNTLRIVLRNHNEYIDLGKESLLLLAESGNTFRIRIKELANTYTVRFLASDDTIIPKHTVDIGIGLPAIHSEQTVYLFADNIQENWGGQYDSYAGSMEFTTGYSGEYTVASPEIVIDDISDLTEYEQQAIRFMAVRGYFELSHGKFNPYLALTRYDFAESLVRMFFALDNDAVCTFPDVDQKHYRYVAASQKDAIVLGFEDGTFRGMHNVTVQEVIALTARTINQQNGYVYPENIEKYIIRSKDNPVEEWAEKEIALATREGIYSKEMNLKFMGDVSRKDAAVMLYRLFMIMNNTPDPNSITAYDVSSNTVHRTFWNGTNAVIVCVAVVVVNIVALIVAFLFINKKRKG